MKRFEKFFLVAFVLLSATPVQSAIVTFDEFDGSQYELTGSGYAGLVWGTSDIDAATGNIGHWTAWDGYGTYATTHSGSNFVYNCHGPNNLFFSFPSPVFFNGAWFATAVGGVEPYRATQVRFTDNLGHASSWLTLAETPQFLNAGFNGPTTIYVERQGGIGTGYPNLGNGRWYTMDDITYNESSNVPVPASLMLLGSGLLGLAWLRKRN